MASTQKLYPRATVKRIVKAHSKKSVSKDVDILVWCQELYNDILRRIVVAKRGC